MKSINLLTTVSQIMQIEVLAQAIYLYTYVDYNNVLSVTLTEL